MRSPRRTAQTSSALMVGLALVSTIAVFGASLSKSATSSVDEAVSADYIITSSGIGPGGFGNAVAPTAATVPGVTAVLDGLRRPVRVPAARCRRLTAVSTDHLPETVILRMVDGAGAPSLAAGELLIDTTTANTKHLSVGSVVPVKFAQTGWPTMRMGGMFKPNALLGSYVVGDGYFLSHFANPLPVAVLVATPAGRRRTGRRWTAA